VEAPNQLLEGTHKALKGEIYGVKNFWPLCRGITLGNRTKTAKNKGDGGGKKR